jgi:small-conductance mechanosensitive channel
VRGAYDVGETIEVGDLRGQIVAIEPDATVLGTDGGRRVRVPNHLLLESVVTIGGGPPETRGQSEETPPS